MKRDCESVECAEASDSSVPIDYESLSRLCSLNVRLASEVNAAIDQRCNHVLKSARSRHAEPLFAATGGTADEAELDRVFREGLVQLMVLAVQCWEQCTGESKIELAQRSEIWCVNVDEGRLRVRSMDRYLAIRKLPKRPRWRDVLRTAYFVLDNVEGDRRITKRLEEALNQTLAVIRKQAS